MIFVYKFYRKRKPLPELRTYRGSDAITFKAQSIIDKSSSHSCSSTEAGKDDERCERDSSVAFGSAISSPASSNALEKTNSFHFSDEDLLQGLCPEDIMNCSTSFSVSVDYTNVGLVQEDGKVSPTESTFKHPSPYHPTNVHTARMDDGSHRENYHIGVCKNNFPQASSDSKYLQSKFPSGTFYGLPMKVETCLQEHRGIKNLYGNGPHVVCCIH